MTYTRKWSDNRSLSLTGRILVIVAVLLGIGCSNALPREEDNIGSRWKHFEEVRKDFDKIESYQTTQEDLKKLGFDPYTQPNIHILSYLDIIQRFMPNDSITLDDLDPAISFCIRSRAQCIGYEAQPSRSKSKRVGNVALDLLTFKRRTMRTGWSFYALIVINDGVVVYKVWSGEPIVSGEKIRKNPLGPIQGVNPGDIGKIL
jgi:hypothetical protein